MDARLGTGGMATVYAATHRNGNRVAIKLLRSSLARDAEVRARFLREGYVSNAVGHPGSMKVLDDGLLDGSPFLVMELLVGESLEARRARLGGRLSVEELVPFAHSLLEVLAAAHRRGIVHRDVKPENVFLTHEGEIKVLDFGIAQMRRAGVDKTGIGLVLGTPDFMAPEQMVGEPDEIDGRTDLWSTGATLFFLLSGQPTHEATTLRAQIVARLTLQARSLGVVAPWVPRPLVDVIDRALQLEKAERWPDADTMRAALHRASSVPDLGAEDHGDEDRTLLQPSRPCFAQLAATLPPPSSERTIAMPSLTSSERSAAIADLMDPFHGGLGVQRAVSGVRPLSVNADDIDIERTELMASGATPSQEKLPAPSTEGEGAASDLGGEAVRASHRRLRDLALLVLVAMVLTVATGLVYERWMAG